MKTGIQSNLAVQIEARAKNALLDTTGLRLAMLYGSMAAGNPRADSDVDLALLFDRPMTALDKMELTTRLGSAVGRSVDLVDLYSLNGTILKQVLIGGRVLVQDGTDPLRRLSHKMIFNQADMMPYATRALKERQQRFVHG